MQSPQEGVPWLFLALIVGGCLDDPSEVREREGLPRAGTTIGFDDPVEAFSCAELPLCAAFEPSIAVGNGGILAASAFGDLARSVDGGRTFVKALNPGLQSERTLGAVGTLGLVDTRDPIVPLDAVVQSDPEGNIWWVAMVQEGFAPDGGSGPLAEGFWVARTTDAGFTWDLNVEVPAPVAEGMHVDRPWLAFSPDVILLAYNSAEDDTGFVRQSHVVRSLDGGATWDAPTVVSANGAGGRPAFAGDGFVLPIWSRGDFHVATSADGRGWATQEVASGFYPAGPVCAAQGVKAHCGWFGQWRGTDEIGVWVVSSTDGGMNWGEPREIARRAVNGFDLPYPWLEMDRGDLVVGFYDDWADGRGAFFEVIRLPGGDVVDGRVLHGMFQAGQLRGPDGYTDFAHFAVDDGTVFAIFHDGERTAFVVRGDP